MNRPAPSGNPLRMMAADYDSAVRMIPPPPPPREPREGVNRPVQSDFNRGKGKGGGKGRHRSDFPVSTRVQDFIVPEMFSDPWLDLYCSLPVDVRHRETRHLSESDQLRVESSVQHESLPKRSNIGEYS